MERAFEFAQKSVIMWTREALHQVTQTLDKGAVDRANRSSNTMNLHNAADTLRFGAPLSQAHGAVILLHGRGSSSRDIAGLADSILGSEIAFLAPSASSGSWYPQRFFVPIEQNEPWLRSALAVVDLVVAGIHTAGIPHERIGFIGFSQGACLALEYAFGHPRRYGFVAALSGALIGPLETVRPVTDFKHMPTLIACAELDPHIPLEFVERSASIFSAGGAAVAKKIFRGSAHTVYPEEIQWLRKQVASWSSLS